MFSIKKRLKQIEVAKQQLEKEKQELLFIKNQLEETTPKIDISNVYIWEEQEVCSIVKLEIKKLKPNTLEEEKAGTVRYLSTLTDIFTNNIIFKKESTETIKEVQWIIKENYEEDFVGGYYAFLSPLSESDKNILAYTDKKVPLYILQQLYYRLNKIDISDYILKKEK